MWLCYERKWICRIAGAIVFFEGECRGEIVGCLVGMQIIFSGRLECPLLSISNIRGGGCMQTAENQFDALEEEKI